MEPSRNGSHPDKTAAQKALAGLKLTLSGLPQSEAARVTGTTPRQIQAVKAALARVPELESQVENGSITLNAVQVAAGYRQHKPVSGRAFGKGDKWLEVANALTQYLHGWGSRDYKFTHIPPKEAGKRVKVIDEMIEGLQAARADLEQRSHLATSAVPSK